MNVLAIMAHCQNPCTRTRGHTEVYVGDSSGPREAQAKDITDLAGRVVKVYFRPRSATIWRQAWFLVFLAHLHWNRHTSLFLDGHNSRTCGFRKGPQKARAQGGVGEGVCVGQTFSNSIRATIVHMWGQQRVVAVVVWQERRVLKSPESIERLLVVVLDTDVAFLELCSSIFAMVPN